MDLDCSSIVDDCREDFACAFMSRIRMWECELGAYRGQHGIRRVSLNAVAMSQVVMKVD